MNIVIVESPAKAKTINKYLGSSYEVLASFGHVRDLPAKNGSVDPDANFKMIWEVDPKAAGRLNDIAKSLKNADRLILATDPDREGEAISWHVLEVLKEKRALKDQKIERVVFNAITKQAVSDAMKHPRQIDGALVDAYMARRALDYLVGFTPSPPCCGASCRAPAPPAACSRWRCASSATASSRSRNSSRVNIGR
ncbi:DNA topoisomerase IA [Bradyrhizobium ottawaense]